MITLTGEQLKAGAESLASEVIQGRCANPQRISSASIGYTFEVKPPSSVGGWSYAIWRTKDKALLLSGTLTDSDVVLRALVLAALSSESCPGDEAGRRDALERKKMRTPDKVRKWLPCLQCQMATPHRIENEGSYFHGKPVCGQKCFTLYNKENPTSDDGKTLLPKDSPFKPLAMTPPDKKTPHPDSGTHDGDGVMNFPALEESDKICSNCRRDDCKHKKNT